MNLNFLFLNRWERCKVGENEKKEEKSDIQKSAIP